MIWAWQLGALTGVVANAEIQYRDMLAPEIALAKGLWVLRCLTTEYSSPIFVDWRKGVYCTGVDGKPIAI